MTGPDAAEIEALAGTPALLERARALALAPWPQAWRSHEAAWTELRARTGRTLRVAARFQPPMARCSCGEPQPCKHGLGLLLLAAERREALARADEPGWLAEWLTPAVPRPRRAARSVAGASAPASRERRAATRLARMMAGLEQLDAWLDEVARSGVAHLGPGGRALEIQAKRLVDAQLPGLGSRLRAGAWAMASGGAWADEALDLLGAVALASAGFRREAELPDGLRHDVRAVVGLPSREADVLERGERLRDVFWVLGVRELADDRLTTRRTWLLGRSGRHALFLEFSPVDGFARAPLPAGARVATTLAYYPSAAPLRATLADEPSAFASTPPPAETFEQLLERAASVLERAPFCPRVAAVLEATPAQLGAALLCEAERALPVTHGDWARLRALSGGRPVRVACEWDGRSLALLGCWEGGAWHSLVAPRLAPEPPRAPSPLRSALLAGTRPEGLPAEALALLGGAPARSGRDVFALAAAQALFERAGALPRRAPAAPPASPDDPRDAPGAPAGALLAALFERGPSEVLQEALGLLLRRGLRLPSEVLPAALSVHAPGLRARVRPLLGERGRWLAREDAAWAWATREADAGSADAARFETASPDARLELLAAARARGEEIARAWVEEILRCDGPERRRAAVVALAARLGLEDEALLESARRDRSPLVRGEAVELLLRLPGSALARAAEARAERYVLARNGELTVRLPGPAFAARWADVGVRETPPPGWGKRVYWLAQMLAAAPPSRLAARLGLTASATVELASRKEAPSALLEGLARGALRFRERELYLPLVRAHAREPWAPALVDDLPLALIPRLGEPARTEESLALLGREGPSHRLLAVLGALPRPFAAELAERLLLELGREGAPEELFGRVALGLPPGHLGVRLRADGGTPRSSQERARARFDATVELRGRVVALLRRSSALV